MTFEIAIFDLFGISKCQLPRNLDCTTLRPNSSLNPSLNSSRSPTFSLWQQFLLEWNTFSLRSNVPNHNPTRHAMKM